MLDPTVTVGFENEWAHNIEGLLATLHANDYLPDAELHRYHCECDCCADFDGQSLRAQRDSSCAGEIISRPFALAHERDELDEITALIERAAIDADAEPGLGAGFHVHARVTPPATFSTDFIRLDATASVRCLAATHLLLPSLVESFAVGAHGELGSLNARSSDRLHEMTRTFIPGRPSTAQVCHGLVDAHAAFTIEGHDDVEHAHEYRELFHSLTRGDRHADVAWRTRYQTVEFRLWRSTRMAWRMTLYVWLSALMVSPAFIDHVLATIGPNIHDGDLLNPTLLIGLVTDAVNAEGSEVLGDLPELLSTQAEYAASLLDDYTRTPTVFTVG